MIESRDGKKTGGKEREKGGWGNTSDMEYSRARTTQ